MQDIRQLQESGLYLVLTPAEFTALCGRLALDVRPLMLKPLLGGMPDLGWEGLELFMNRVVPSLSAPARP